MEKVIYVLWAPPEAQPALAEALRGSAGSQLLDLGTRGLQVNAADAAVTRPLFAPAPEQGKAEMAAVVNLWLDSARDGARRPYDRVVEALGHPWAGYIVTESEPIVPVDPPEIGHRMDGFAQFVLLQIPDGMTRDHWRDTWQGLHTPVAIDTQSTFRYVQNIVARAFHPGPADIEEVAAIVEECFPIGAMTDLAVFYDSVGDEERLARHSTQMMESVARFMPEGVPPMVWTSEYILRHRH